MNTEVTLYEMISDLSKHFSESEKRLWDFENIKNEGLYAAIVIFSDNFTTAVSTVYIAHLL